jgi:hypothetical protein
MHSNQQNPEYLEIHPVSKASQHVLDHHVELKVRKTLILLRYREKYPILKSEYLKTHPKGRT